MKKLPLILLIILLGCEGKDIVFDEVDPSIRITNPIISLEVSTSYPFEYTFLNNVGVETQPSSITWTTSAPEVLTINSRTGLAQAVSMGEVRVGVRAELDDLEADTSITFMVSGNTIIIMPGNTERVGSINSGESRYGLRGRFRLFQEDDHLILEFDDTYHFDGGVPGPYLYLTNNKNSIGGGYEIGRVTVLNGAHRYRIPTSEVSLNDFSVVYYYCKPFGITLGFGRFTN